MVAKDRAIDLEPAGPNRYTAGDLSLTPGTRLGVYEVTALLGKGGMGQVYWGTDTKLKRQVAIKMLPPSRAADADRLARFQREAEVLASLNHPNVAVISPEAESLRSRPRDSEAVPARGGGAPRGLNIEEALPIAKQIAANIKVRADGTVKVLDFVAPRRRRKETVM